MERTSCESCDNVHMDTRKLSSGQWQCVKFPRLRGINPVAPEGWTDPPYMRCSGINGGFCPLWEQRRDEKIPVKGKQNALEPVSE